MSLLEGLGSISLAEILFDRLIWIPDMTVIDLHGMRVPLGIADVNIQVQKPRIDGKIHVDSVLSPI